MADYAKDVKQILSANGCYFLRRGKGDHDIWYSPITNRIVSIDAKMKKRHTANRIFNDAGINRKV